MVRTTPEGSQLTLVVRQALLVLQLGQAAAQRQHAAAEVAVRRELAAEVFRRPTVEQVAAAWALPQCSVIFLHFPRYKTVQQRGQGKVVPAEWRNNI